LVTKSGEVMLSYHAQVVLSDRSARNFRPIMFADNRRPFVNDIQLNTDETAVIASTDREGMWQLSLTQLPLRFNRIELSNLDRNYSIARISSFLQDREKNLWLGRSEEHTSELQSRENLVCRL